MAFTAVAQQRLPDDLGTIQITATNVGELMVAGGAARHELVRAGSHEQLNEPLALLAARF